jgi:hypothetical protein
MSFKEIFPPIATTLEMEPEELAPFVLRYLAKQGQINRYNFSLGPTPDLVEFAGNKREELPPAAATPPLVARVPVT